MPRATVILLGALWLNSCFFQGLILVNAATSTANPSGAGSAVATLYRLGSKDPFGFMDSGHVSIVPLSTIPGEGTIYEVHAIEKAGKPTKTISSRTSTRVTTGTVDLKSERSVLSRSAAATRPSGQGVPPSQAIGFTLPSNSVYVTTRAMPVPAVTEYEGNALAEDISTIYTISQAASSMRTNATSENCTFFPENGTAVCIVNVGVSDLAQTVFSTTTGTLMPWYTVRAAPLWPMETPNHAGASSPPASGVGRSSARVSLELLLILSILEVLLLQLPGSIMNDL